MSEEPFSFANTVVLGGYCDAFHSVWLSCRPAGTVGCFLMGFGEGHYIISDLLRGGVNQDIEDLRKGRYGSGSLCAPQFPYLCGEELDLL